MGPLWRALISSASAPCRAEDWADAARPVYRGVEGVVDGVYGLIRGHLFSAMLPGRLSRRMSAVPVGSSEAIFAERLRARQERATRRVLESRPSASGPAALAEWQDSALRAHTTVVTDAFADTLIRRYQLERFGKDSGAYARDPRNWDPEFLSCAAVFGGAYLYVAGLRTDWNMGPVRVGLDARPGAALRSAAQNGEGRGLAMLTLSRRGSPLSLKTEWGVAGGRMTGERVGLNYSTRF